MNAQPLVCPPSEQLRAFGLGQKLDPDIDAAIAEHLKSCTACLDAVAAASGDDFIARRRAAEQANPPSQGTPAPDGSLGGLARSLTRAADSKLAAVSAPADIPPELANHPEYEVIRELGRGGMGVVYLVKNRLMDRLEALKVMSTGLAARSGASDRFLQEIRSAGQLTHQYVVQAHSARQAGDFLMLSMEYVPDGDLGTLVKEKGPLPVVNACYYTWQVALALQHAHEKGMVHRDIKPSNLILQRNGKRHTVKVTDFGLAKARKDSDESGLTAAGQMMGTPHYMPPEQARDAAQVDIRADIYSLGCTLYFLLTGQTPFSGGPLEVLWKHREEAPRPVNELRPEVPAEVEAIVEKMMAKDPADRYQTPAEVAKALSPHLKRGPRPELSQATVATAAPQSTAAGTQVPMPLPPDRTDQWGELTFSDSPTVVPAPAPEQQRRRPFWVWPALIAGGLLVGLLVALGAGAFKIKGKDGTIVLENLPDDAEVVVDGDTVTVSRNGEEATITISREGPDHRLRVMLGGKEIFSKDVTVALGGEPVRVRIEPEESPPGLPDPRPKPTDSFVSLFNGEDLGGWVQDNPGSVVWSVHNRLLLMRAVGSAEARELATVRKDYGNFHLKMRVKHEDGICFLNVRRSEPAYRILIGSTNDSLLPKTGRGSIDRSLSLGPPKKAGFETVAGPARIKPGVWFNLEVIAENDRIRTLINGRPAAELRDTRGALPPGRIALGGGPKARMQIESIEIKELQPQFEVKAGATPKLVGTANWQKQGDELVGAVKAKEVGAVVFGDEKWTDYDFSADIYFSLGAPRCTLACRSEGKLHLYGFVLAPSLSKAIIIRGIGEKDIDTVAEGTARLPTRKWLTVKVSVREKRLNASVQETGTEGAIAAISHDDVLFPSGGVALILGSWGHQEPGVVRFRNVKVTKPDGTVLWAGLPELPK